VLKIVSFIEYDTRPSANAVCKLWNAVGKSLAEAESEDEEGDDDEEGRAMRKKDADLSDSDDEYDMDGLPPAEGAGDDDADSDDESTPKKKQNSDSKNHQRVGSAPPKSSTPLSSKSKSGSKSPRIVEEEDDDEPPPPPDYIPSSVHKSLAKSNSFSPNSKNLHQKKLSLSPRRPDLQPLITFLKKRSHKNRHLWQRRLFVFQPPVESNGPVTPGRATITDREGDRDRPKIAYYKTEKEFQAKVAPQGVLFFDQIKECTIATDGKGAEVNCRFDLVLASRRIHLIADSEKTAAQWIKIIFYYMPSSPEETGIIYEGLLSKKKSSFKTYLAKTFFCFGYVHPNRSTTTYRLL